MLINQLTAGAAYCGSSANWTGSMTELACAGTTSLSRGDMALLGSATPAKQATLLLLGGRAGQRPLGGDTLCPMDPLHRMHLGSSDLSGEVRFPITSNDLPAAYPGAVIAGSSRRFQLWHRDTTDTGFALSNGVRVTCAPWDRAPVE